MDRFIIEQRTGKRPPVKTIYLVRHGESTHNARSFASEGAGIDDERYIDAQLTTLGKAQARSLTPKLKELDINLVVCSPMTRATQTCLIACDGTGLPLPVVSPLCTERLAYSCDIGSPVSELRRRFPNLDYGLVTRGEAWWWLPDKSGEQSQSRSLALLKKHPSTNSEPRTDFNIRMNDFRVWLLQRPEKRIIVFAHGVFLKSLMNANVMFGNGELRRWRL